MLWRNQPMLLFQPPVMCTKSAAYNRSRKHLEVLEMPEIVELGSLYLDGQCVVPVATCCEDYRIPSIGDTSDVETRWLHWVRDGNLLICDRTICLNVSWNTLNNQGYIIGAPVFIDGKSYLCRSLRGGAKAGNLNEWDALLNKYGEEDALWHWNGHRFWGQEEPEPKDVTSFRVVRGGDSARGWANRPQETESWTVGFRPVLEPFVSPLAYLDSLLGKNIRVIGPQGISFWGRLVAIDDYDIELVSPSPVPSGCRWAIANGQEVCIGKAAIFKVEQHN